MKRRIGLSVSSARLYVLLCSVFWDNEARALLLLVDTWRSGVRWGGYEQRALYPSIPLHSCVCRRYPVTPPWDGRGPQKARSFSVVTLQRSPCPQHKLSGWGDALLPLERAAPESQVPYGMCFSGICY